MKDGELRLMRSKGISRPIPRSERSVQVKTAREIHAIQSQKTNLDGLYEVLAPGSTVGKISPTTRIIKERNRPEVCVRNSDIAQLGLELKEILHWSSILKRVLKSTGENT